MKDFENLPLGAMTGVWQVKGDDVADLDSLAHRFLKRPGPWK
jgi:hypothetical protein